MIMQKMIASVVGGLLILSAGVYFGTPGKEYISHISVTKYETVENLEQEADMIVVATPEKDFSDSTPTITYTKEGRYGDYYTVTDVKVQKVLKGEVSDKTLPVIEGAALVSNPLKNQKDTLILDHYSVMEKGKKYLLFLKKNEAGQYGILGVFQGKFNVDALDNNEKTVTEGDKHYSNLKKNALEKHKTKI